ncbi:hypothetical protein ACQ4PT_013788 [Festuca glaucescens]
MGASGKWIKTLVGLKPAAAEKEKHGGGGKSCKWIRLWWSSSGGRRGAASAAASETSSSAAAALSSAVAAIMRATPKDFRVITQEWAALRIQTAFRGFLARTAVRALRGIVTFKCMQAVMRMQARELDRLTPLSADGRDSHDALNDRGSHTDPVKEAEPGRRRATLPLRLFRLKSETLP